MKPFVRCTRCLVPNTRPDTFFNAEGVCSACLSYAARDTVDWDERWKMLVEIIASAKPSPDGYHCVVPSSGGKDSHAQVAALQRAGARVFTVNARTCHLTAIGRQNLDNLARYAPGVEVVPNMRDRAKLNRIGLEQVGDISWPEHMAIFTTPFRVAQQMGIGLVFYGENPQEAYGGPPGSEAAAVMTRRWVSEFGGFLGLRASDIPEIDPTIDPAPYCLPAETERLPTAYFLGHYMRWDSHENANIAKQMGMQDAGDTTDQDVSCANWWGFENLDNAQTGIHDHAMYLKYGYGRACAQLSVDIRAGLLNRAQALWHLEHDDGRFPYTYMGEPASKIVHQLGYTTHSLRRRLRQFTNADLFENPYEDEPCVDIKLKQEYLA